MEIGTQNNCVSALESYLQVENEKSRDKKESTSSLVDSLRPRDTVSISDEAKQKALEMLAQNKDEEDSDAAAQDGAGGSGGAGGAAGGDDSADQIAALEKAIAQAQKELGSVASSDLPEASKEARVSTLQAKISQLTQELSALKTAAAKSA